MTTLVDRLTDLIIVSDLVLTGCDDYSQVKIYITDWVHDCLIDILRGYPGDCMLLADSLSAKYHVLDVDKLQTKIRNLVDIPLVDILDKKY